MKPNVAIAMKPNVAIGIIIPNLPFLKLLKKPVMML